MGSESRCPICGYVYQPLETECARCRLHPKVAPVPPVVSPPVVPPAVPRGGPVLQQSPIGFGGGWNWGASVLSLFWGVSHDRYIVLAPIGLCLVAALLEACRFNMDHPAFPWIAVGALVVVFLGFCPCFGLMGNDWAWASGRFATVQECRDCQRRWAAWAVPVVVLLAVLLTGFAANCIILQIAEHWARG